MTPLLTGSATAHPHVWIDAKTELIFENGKMTGVRHIWTFDDMYSAFVTQGVGKNPDQPTPDELLPIAKSNMEALPEFDYFTVVQAGGQKAEFATPTEYSMAQTPQRLITLTFTLPLKSPLAFDKSFGFQVFDPSYFVAFTLEKESAIGVRGLAAGCRPKIVPPQALDADDRKKLDESAISGLPPGVDFGMKMAGHVAIVCP